MSDQCPCCNGTGVLPDQEWNTYVLYEGCKRRGIGVAPDGTVNRRDAASLIRRSPITLRNWQLRGKPGLPCFKRNGRYRYKLTNLAKWLYAYFDD